MKQLKVWDKFWEPIGANKYRKHHVIAVTPTSSAVIVTSKYWRKRKKRWQYKAEELEIIQQFCYLKKPKSRP